MNVSAILEIIGRDNKIGPKTPKMSKCPKRPPWPNKSINKAIIYYKFNSLSDSLSNKASTILIALFAKRHCNFKSDQIFLKTLLKVIVMSHILFPFQLGVNHLHSMSRSKDIAILKFWWHDRWTQNTCKPKFSFYL